MKTIQWIFMGVGVLFFVQSSFGAIKGEVVEYRNGDVVCQGYLAYDDAVKSKTPAVVLVHDWLGVGPYVKGRAEQIVRLGYIAFAVDMYGKGVRPRNVTEASQQASLYRKDRTLMRKRALAGLDFLKKNPLVDPKRIVVMGYCFGGGVALETARSGADLRGAVSFHGNLDTPHPDDAKNIKAKILVLHGADDPNVPPEQVLQFQNEMRNAKVDWQMVLYGNAVHSFTNPEAGNDPSKGVAYNQSADKRSWQAFESFLKEAFQ